MQTMGKSSFSASDEKYITEAFRIIADGYTQSLADGRVTPSEYDKSLWLTPRTLISYYFQLTPDDEIQPYYSLLGKLNERSIRLIEKHCAVFNDKRELNQIINTNRHLFDFQPWRLEQIDTYHQLLDNPGVWQQLIDDYPGSISREQAEMLLRNSNSMPLRQEVSAVKWQGQIVGQVRLEFADDGSKNSSEISYWLGENYWGKGLMSKIIPLYTHRCFLKYPMKTVFALVLDINKASKRVLEKAGYRLDTNNYRTITKAGKRLRMAMYRAYRIDFLGPSSSNPTLEAGRKRDQATTTS